MSHIDLRDWLEAVERRGELKHISGANWDLEMGSIAELVFRVLTNIHAFEYIGGIGTIGRGKIDFELMEEIKREVQELEHGLAREEVSLKSRYLPRRSRSRMV